MRISIIAALSSNHVIGRDNALPWHLPADLKHFKSVTMGKPVIMGRRTYESIGRPLPGRINIVVTSNPAFVADGCEVVPSIEKALELVREYDEIMVIGGASFYAQMLPRAGRMYLTLVHAEVDGDAYFPDYRASEWRQSERRDFHADDRNNVDYSFVVLDRVAEA